MGKNKHSKDRMFVTATEHKYLYGGKRERAATDYRRLPFDHCALSFAPFDTPVATPEGHVFDLVNILPHLVATAMSAPPAVPGSGLRRAGRSSTTPTSRKACLLTAARR